MRLVDRFARRAGYWEGLASGAAVLTTSYGSPDREAVLPQVASWAKQAYSQNSVVFAAILVRLLVFSQATFRLQALDDKHLFGNTSLSVLEHPFGPDTASGELLVRMEQDISLAGNSYTWQPPGEDFLVRLRPDWTTIVSEIVTVPGGGRYRRKVGYFVKQPMRGIDDQDKGDFYPAEEVAHWAPVPDPDAAFRGMSWMTPAYRDIKGDDGMGTYKVRYLENAASPNLLIKYAQKLQPGTIDSIRERMQARYGGADNAFKTLVLDQGADVTVIGNSLQQMDFSGVSAAGEQRILADSGVPGVLVGLEPLRGAGRGYQESMQKFAGTVMQRNWQSACAVLEKFVDTQGGNRLWFDTSDIPVLRDNEMERAQTALVKAQAMQALRQAGADFASSTTAIESLDFSQLKMSGLPVPPLGQGQGQHMLPQAQPGATAVPLPPTLPRLALASVSPGDGGNGTRPTPRPASARRTAETPIASTVHEPLGKPGGPGLFHHKGLQLPAYIQHVAHRLLAQGHDESRAIEMAIGIVRNWAHGHDGHGNNVHPDVQAAAAAAIAEWDALKARH